MTYDPRTQSYYIPGTIADYTTTGDAYADVGTWAIGHFGTKQMRFSAATNNLDVTIFGSFDEGITYPITVVSEFAVTTATPVIQTITALYTHLKVQTKPAGAGNNGTLSTEYVGWSRSS